MNENAKRILRISMSLVFLYFGFMQVRDPDAWIGFVPEFLYNIIITPNNLVVMNGIIELTLGTFLILGLFTKLSSLILSIHLFFISLSLGLTPLGVRDIGLSLATFVVFLNGPDSSCLDKRIDN